MIIPLAATQSHHGLSILIMTSREWSLPASPDSNAARMATCHTGTRQGSPSGSAMGRAWWGPGRPGRPCGTFQKYAHPDILRCIVLPPRPIRLALEPWQQEPTLPRFACSSRIPFPSHHVTSTALQLRSRFPKRVTADRFRCSLYRSLPTFPRTSEDTGYYVT